MCIRHVITCVWDFKKNWKVAYSKLKVELSFWFCFFYHPRSRFLKLTQMLFSDLQWLMLSLLCHALPLLSTSCWDFYTVRGTYYWIWEMNEGRITHSASSIFIGMGAFTGLPLTFNCRVEAHAMGCYSAKPDFNQILMTSPIVTLASFPKHCAAEKSLKVIV